MGDAHVTESLRALCEREFPILRERAYLNGAQQGLLPVRSVEAVRTAAEECLRPDLPTAPYEQIARERLARLIGAQPEEIAFISNTTHGMNIAVQGIAWREGDNIVVPYREFPSLSVAMLHLRDRGVEVRLAPFSGAGPTVDDLMSHVNSRTRAVACSSITWDSGYRADLESLGKRCAEQGCLLVVDGIQLVGAGELDVKAARISAMSMHGYKWLLAVFGVAALYVAPEAIDQISPTFVGADSLGDGSDISAGVLNWKPGAGRYQAGSGNKLGLAALASSLGLIDEVGIETIAERNRMLGERLYAGLRSKESVETVSSDDPARRSQIVVFTLGTPDRDKEMVEKLEEQGIVICQRTLGLRASPNFYNSEDDVDRLLAALPD
ncbi:MAG TPA: aminotransferase class V-fold PLP-dependent enzyme [Nitrolancea sp.]|nr:aminotransferase class V-fold PLP-dependent enzyme [Nitrolancea sp.]